MTRRKHCTPSLQSCATLSLIAVLPECNPDRSTDGAAKIIAAASLAPGHAPGAHLLRRTNEAIPIPQPARYPKPGWDRAAYRISYDAQKKEYRVAIVDFTWRE